MRKSTSIRARATRKTPLIPCTILASQELRQFDNYKRVYQDLARESVLYSPLRSPVVR